jgi:hypothetical protein
MDDNTYGLFGDRIFCTPQVDAIESTQSSVLDFHALLIVIRVVVFHYSLLGSPRLSSLVREDHRTSRELPDSKIGANIRHLILDRLPLFLHNQSPSRTKLTSDWMNNKENFIVKVFEKITVIKSLHHGDTHESSSYDTSVISKREGSGPIELLLAENMPLKVHE